MIGWYRTLKQLRDEIDRMIARMGENAPVGTAFTKSEPFDMEFVGPSGAETHEAPAGEYIDLVGVQVEWVCIDSRTGLIVGDEGNDYETKLKPGEVNAVKLS